MNQRTDYLDLEVQVSANTSGGLEVQILNSPRDRPRGVFEPPYPSAQAIELLAGIDQAIYPTDADADEPVPPNLRQIGGKLFDALFPSALRPTLDASLDRLRGGEEGLRLRLSFDPKVGQLACSGALPWEVLYHAARRQFLAKRPEVALVRYLDVPLDIQRLFVQLPLKVLLIAPEPKGVEEGTVKEEERLVYGALEKTPGIHVERVQPPTLEHLLDRLAPQDIHVVHFMGHGGRSEESSEAGLLFENEQGEEDLVMDQDLAEQLAPFCTSLKLMVLNACYSGSARREGDQMPFAGVTSALISHGMTAVVGMQFQVTHSVAMRFADTFYRRLADSGQLETAAADARRALHQLSPLEWITPAVFTRAANGRLFDPSMAPSPKEAVRIGIRSFFGWGVELEDWSHVFLPLTSFFRERYPLADMRWHEDIYSTLESSLTRAVIGRRAVHLDFAAHQSIAFAVGYWLEAKAGLQITVRQRSAEQTTDWRADDPSLPDAWSWDFDEVVVDEAQPDIALAIGPTRDLRSSVKSFVEQQLPSVGRILDCRPPAGASQTSVENGWHAMRLAEAISNKMHELTPGDGAARFHLFFAGPNGLLFFLGRLCRGPRQVQLYEYDFDGHGNRTYIPSLWFPPPKREGG